MNEQDVLMPFLRAVPWNRFAGARYSYVAYERENGRFNLHCRLTLLPVKERVRLTHGEAHGLRVESGWLASDAARAAIEHLASGQVRIRGRELLLKHPADDRGYSWWTPSTFDYARERIGWAGTMLQGTGPQMGQVLEPRAMAWLADRLVAMRPHRLMTTEDLGRFIGPHATFEDSYIAQLEFFVPTCARLGLPSYRPRSRQLAVPVESYLDPIKQKMELLVSATAGGLPVVIPARTWRRQRPYRWIAVGDVRHLEGRIDLTLVASGEKVWRCSSAIPVLTARLLDALESGEVWLRKLLFPSDARQASALGFERGVVALLALGGLAAIPTGFAGLDGYVDIVCSASEHQVLVGECTVGVPAPKKLADLRGRTVRALERIRLTGEQLEAHSCVFTPLPRNSIPHEILAEADKLGVTVISRESLDELLEAARAGDLANGLWAKLIANRQTQEHWLRSPAGHRRRR